VEGAFVIKILVPMLTLSDERGHLDRAASVAYVQRARESWLDGFLVAGSLGLGATLAGKVRRDLVSVWLDNVAADRVLVCAWRRDELDEIADTGARPVLVLRDLGDEDAVLRAFESLPANALVYSHPQYTKAVLTPAVVDKGRAAGSLPAGAKVSKVGLGDVRALREAAGPEFALFDGRCRDVRASVAAGASGVVAVPLTVLPEDLPPRGDVDALQAVIDRGQVVVDAHSDVADQADALRKMLLETL